MAQYLTYEEYKALYNGTLDEAVFTDLERNAEYRINAQAGGQTGVRISKLSTIPLSVKDCVYAVIQYLSSIHYSDGEMYSAVTSESQSSNGVSESYTYKTTSQIDERINVNEIIETFLMGTRLLYKGVDCNCDD